MAHALTAFIRKQMDERRLRNRDLVANSGLSRQLVSKYVNDDRDQLARIPKKETVDGFAKAFNVSPEFVLGKAIEALGLGYSSGDFVNSVATATDAELLVEIERRLRERGEEHADRSATIKTPESDPADQSDNVHKLPNAARHTRSGKRSIGQQKRDAMTEAGEENQDV